MEAIAYYYLLGFGFLLIGVEILIFSFYLFWIGLGFIMVSILSMFINFDNGLTQIAIALILGLIMLYFFKKPLEKMMKPQSKPEIAIHKHGIGTIIDGSIKMDGTFWQTDDDLSSYKNGDKVNIIIKSTKASIVQESSS